ncbi:MAG: hypothetical protein KAJ17_13705 [Candidatus Krumholzibacteria bacterium]|nr:hypothetical protein [Candidatus Krumholzibacteria bacterium]
MFILLPALFVALYLVGYSFLLCQKLDGASDTRTQDHERPPRPLTV